MENFFYIIGEAKSAVITESSEVLAFTEAQMGAVDTNELLMVIGNVYGKGHFFPGPEEVVTSIIHEVVRRWDVYQQFDRSQSYCVFITALKKLDGEIAAAPLAIVPTADHQLSQEENNPFYLLLLEALPAFQDTLTQVAYAPDTKLISIIKDATEYHENKGG